MLTISQKITVFTAKNETGLVMYISNREIIRKRAIHVSSGILKEIHRKNAVNKNERISRTYMSPPFRSRYR